MTGEIWIPVQQRNLIRRESKRSGAFCHACRNKAVQLMLGLALASPVPSSPTSSNGTSGKSTPGAEHSSNHSKGKELNIQSHPSANCFFWVLHSLKYWRIIASQIVFFFGHYIWAEKKKGHKSGSDLIIQSLVLYASFSSFFFNNNLIMTLKLCEDYSVNLKRNTEMTQPCSANLFTLPLASLRSYWQEPNHRLTRTLSTGLFRFPSERSTLLFLIFLLCSGGKKPRNQWVLLLLLLLLCVFSSLYVHKLQIMW